MKDVYAFVVGIDCYDEPGWDVSGPGLNAVAFVEALLEVEAEPADVFLFLATEDKDLMQRADKLAAEGVVLSPGTTWAEIDTFWRQDLKNIQRPGSRLFTYWSGHGYADDDGDRIFLCRDFTVEDLTNRVFNCTKFHRHLRGPDYLQFEEQICLADVCATKTAIELDAAKDVPGGTLHGTQVAFFATPEGEYAKGGDGVGVFTGISLEVLRSSAGWREPAEFAASMRAQFALVDQAMFAVTYLDKHGEAAEQRVGQVAGRSRSATFDSVFSLLDGVKLPDSAHRSHYLRTVRTLGEPGLNQAQGLLGMVRELASLADSDSRVPYGLLEFLVRLTEEDALAGPIDEWLAENAGKQKNELATIEKRLAEERSTQVLLVELMSDNQGKFESYQLFLRTSSLAPVPGVSFQPREVAGWEAFQTVFAGDVTELIGKHGVGDLEVHFLAEPPLFPNLFHSIETATGPLGEEYIVVLRYGTRLRSSKQVERKSWCDYANALRTKAPAKIELLAVPNDPKCVPKGKGLCYAGFVVPPSLAGGVPCQEIKTLTSVLRRGTPYLYWMHSLPGGASLDHVEQEMHGWLGAIKTLDDLPVKLSQERRAGNDLASQATLLWDDPEFNPFRVSTGVSVK